MLKLISFSIFTVNRKKKIIFGNSCFIQHNLTEIDINENGCSDTESDSDNGDIIVHGSKAPPIESDTYFNASSR